MTLVTSKEMLVQARKGRYAIGAFNVENMEMIKAVIEAAKELNSPVILQTTPSTIKYGTIETYVAMVSAEAKKANVDVCLHLDHGNSYILAKECIEKGYTSVMIDGSGGTFEENIVLSESVVALAHKNGIPVEAELGKVGGKEDDHEAVADTNTDPDEAKEFVTRTGIDSLAIAIGTAHGFYEGIPALDKKRISSIFKKVSIPLVLHGSSGLSMEDVEECVSRGICKVNFATELRVAYTDAIKQLLKEDPKVYDPKAFGNVGILAVKKLVMKRIKVCGSIGKSKT